MPEFVILNDDAAIVQVAILLYAEKAQVPDARPPKEQDIAVTI